MGNAALRGSKQDGVQGAICVPFWASYAHAHVHTHKHPCIHTQCMYSLRHTGTHMHRLTHTRAGRVPPTVRAEGRLWKLVPGDHHVDGVFHRQLQLELSFVGPRRVVLTEGRQRALSFSLALSLYSNQPPSSVLFAS